MDTAIRPMPIDLYGLRCAVAALVIAVAHEGLLDVLGYRRVELALRTLTAAAARLSPTSAIRRAIERLVSPDDDPGDSRTRGAIAELARLTHVDISSAAGLAAELLPSLPKPHQGDLFGANAADLFDGQEGDPIGDEEKTDLTGKEPPGHPTGLGDGDPEDDPA